MKRGLAAPSLLVGSPAVIFA